MKTSKFKGLIAVTLCLVVVKVAEIVYEKSIVPSVGRHDEEGWKMFRPCEELNTLEACSPPSPNRGAEREP